MKVELLPHKGKNMATQQEQQLPQYMVVADGELIGYKSWKFGSKIVLIKHLSPEDIKEVKNQVEHILGDTAGHVNAPNEDRILARHEEEKAKEEEVQHDDFN